MTVLPTVERVARPEPLNLCGSTLFEGDALTVLRRLPSASVRCVVTSPGESPGPIIGIFCEIYGNISA